MSECAAESLEQEYLFTFQDETKFWIPKKFIEKYPEFPFYDIVQQSDRYDDGSYYVDMPSFNTEKMIHFFMEDNMDISSLDLKESFDIYQLFLVYSISIDNEKKSDLLCHIKELFNNYLNENHYSIYKYVESIKRHENVNIPMELFNSEEKEIHINGLFTTQRKEKLFYFLFLFRMMNITKVDIEYQYSSNIPLEYICPSCIKDIFPSLKELIITVITNYKESEVLLNPNSNEYIKRYIHLLYRYGNNIDNSETYDYYTEREMNEYNNISLVNTNKLKCSNDLLWSYNKRKEDNQLPKLYKNVINEAIYTNDYSEVDINKSIDEDIIKDRIMIQFDENTNDKTFYIQSIFSNYGISQLLSLLSYYSITKIMFDTDIYKRFASLIVMKSLEDGVFDSLTILSVKWIKGLADKTNHNSYIKIMNTHIFPNVTEIIYDYESFQLSLIKKQCFPNLHIIQYEIDITIDNFGSLFPKNLISLIDTIHIHDIDNSHKPEIASLLDNLIYTHSIYIDGIDNEEYDNNNPNEIDMKESLEIFFKSHLLEHLSDLTISFSKTMNINYLTWISTLFNDNKFKTIHELAIDLYFIKKDLSPAYLTVYETILKKIIPKASTVTIKYCYITFINKLIITNCFLNTTQLTLEAYDLPDDNFYILYTTNNFHQLKYIELRKYWDKELLIIFIQELYKYICNNNFPILTAIKIMDSYSGDNYIYNPNTSIFRCKYDNSSSIESIIGTENQLINKYEIETLFDCINENRTQNCRYFEIYIYNDKQLSKFINYIITGKIPILKEFIVHTSIGISYKQMNVNEQQLKDSSFIQKNHVYYKFKTI
ncbi:hypothetical protein WA158_000749 [Blastocystis sp. Blastoise]